MRRERSASWRRGSGIPWLAVWGWPTAASLIFQIIKQSFCQNPDRRKPFLFRMSNPLEYQREHWTFSCSMEEQSPLAWIRNCGRKSLILSNRPLNPIWKSGKKPFWQKEYITPSLAFWARSAEPSTFWRTGWNLQEIPEEQTLLISRMFVPLACMKGCWNFR